MPPSSSPPPPPSSGAPTSSSPSSSSPSSSSPSSPPPSSSPQPSSVPPRAVAPTRAARPDVWRWLLAGVLGIAGGYLVLGSTIQLAQQFILPAGALQVEVVLNLLAQLAFGIVLALLGYFGAPGTLVARILASALFVVGTAVVGLIFTVRMKGGIAAGPGDMDQLLRIMLNPSALILLIGAAGWLLASGARPLAWVTLAATVVMFPLHEVMSHNDILPSYVFLVSHVISFGIAALVLAASWPRARSPRAHTGPGAPDATYRDPR